jgi:hypothetical protein
MKPEVSDLGPGDIARWKPLSRCSITIGMGELPVGEMIGTRAGVALTVACRPRVVSSRWHRERR